eukprot:363606-Chlamydomonas_euryale.AAC.5
MLLHVLAERGRLVLACWRCLCMWRMIGPCAQLGRLRSMPTMQGPLHTPQDGLQGRGTQGWQQPGLPGPSRARG